MSSTDISIEQLLAQVIQMQDKINKMEQEIITLKSIPVKSNYYMPSYNVDFSKINFKEQCYY